LQIGADPVNPAILNLSNSRGLKMRENGVRNHFIREPFYIDLIIYKSYT
jgi:hypothetical protein